MPYGSTFAVSIIPVNPRPAQKVSGGIVWGFRTITVLIPANERINPETATGKMAPKGHPSAPDRWLNIKTWTTCSETLLCLDLG